MSEVYVWRRRNEHLSADLVLHLAHLTHILRRSERDVARDRKPAGTLGKGRRHGCRGRRQAARARAACRDHRLRDLVLHRPGGGRNTRAARASAKPTRSWHRRCRAPRHYDLVVAISRSGTTTEVVRALDALPAGTPSLAISAVPDTPVVQAAADAVLLEFADESSIVQTRFATTVLALLRADLGHDVGTGDRGGRGRAVPAAARRAVRVRAVRVPRPRLERRARVRGRPEVPGGGGSLGGGIPGDGVPPRADQRCRTEHARVVLGRRRRRSGRRDPRHRRARSTRVTQTRWPSWSRSSGRRWRSRSYAALIQTNHST